MLRHVGERPRQANQLVAPLHDQLGRQVSGRHLAHAIRNHQQGCGQLLAEHDRQQNGAEHGKKQCERQRADVHAAQTVAAQRTLLILTVGLLHRQRIGHQRRGQRLDGLQQTLLAHQPHGARRDQNQRADARLTRRWRLGVAHIVQPFDQGRYTLRAQIAHELGRGPLGRQIKPGLPRAGDQPAGAAP